MSSLLSASLRRGFLVHMGIETIRIVLLALGGVLAVSLAVLPRLACRRYAEAVVRGRDRAAGVWAFIAAGGGSGSAAR